MNRFPRFLKKVFWKFFLVKIPHMISCVIKNLIFGLAAYHEITIQPCIGTA